MKAVHTPFVNKLRRDLWAKRLLVTALTMILTVAICSYMGLMGVYNDLIHAEKSYYQQTHLTNFFINLKRAPFSSLSLVKGMPNIKRLRARVTQDVMVDLPRAPIPIPGIAISLPPSPKNIINGIKLHSGRWFSSPDAAEVILLQQVADAHHLKPGDWLKVRLLSGQYKVLIVGTAYSSEYVFVKGPGAELAPDPAGYAVMFMPKRYLQEHSDLKGAYNQLLGLVIDRNQTAIKNTMTMLAEKLDHYGVLSKTAREDQISVKMLDEELVNIQVSTTIFPSIFLLIAALVVNVLVTRLVIQQRVIIGTFKALGVSNLKIFMHYLSFGSIVGILGGVFGSLFGFWLQRGLLVFYTDYFQMPTIQFHFHIDIIITGFMISILTALVGSLSGAMRAIRLTPAEAMRPASPVIGRSILLEHIQVLWVRLSFKTKLVFRSIFRNRFRSFVTLAAAIAATAVLFSSISLNDSINKMVVHQYNKVEHEDFTLTLRDPLGPKVMSTLSTLPNVAALESQLVVSAVLTNGPFQKQIEITGLPADSKLYTPLDREGRQIQLRYPGVVLSQALANILHVGIGDKIDVKPLLGERREVDVPVTRVVRTYFGLSAYANQTWLSGLLGNSWVTNQILVKLLRPNDTMDFTKKAARFAMLTNIESLQKSRLLLKNTLDQFMTMFIRIAFLFSGGIAISTILNNSMVSLSERERDVATFSVLGMTRQEIFRLFFAEGAILNALGLLLGLGAGILLTKLQIVAYETELYRFDLVINPIRFFETAGLMIMFFSISYFIIYRMMLRIRWLDVLNIRE